MGWAHLASGCFLSSVVIFASTKNHTVFPYKGAQNFSPVNFFKLLDIFTFPSDFQENFTDLALCEDFDYLLGMKIMACILFLYKKNIVWAANLGKW